MYPNRESAVVTGVVESQASKALFTFFGQKTGAESGQKEQTKHGNARRQGSQLKQRHGDTGRNECHRSEQYQWEGQPKCKRQGIPQDFPRHTTGKGLQLHLISP